MTRAAVLYVWLVLELVAALALAYLVAFARMPNLEAFLWGSAFGMAFLATSPTVIRALRRRMR